MSRPPLPSPARRGRGFTLVELMIALVVLGVLAAIALPSFIDSLRKSRRSEAFAAIAAVQQAQERWRSRNPEYTTSLADLALPSSTPAGHYAVSVSASAVEGDTLATAYVVTAVGADGSSQAADRQCRRLSVQVRGGNVGYAGCGSCDSFRYAATHPCWPH